MADARCSTASQQWIHLNLDSCSRFNDGRQDEGQRRKTCICDLKPKLKKRRRMRATDREWEERPSLRSPRVSPPNSSSCIRFSRRRLSLAFTDRSVPRSTRLRTHFAPSNLGNKYAASLLTLCSPAERSCCLSGKRGSNCESERQILNFNLLCVSAGLAFDGSSGLHDVLC